MNAENDGEAEPSDANSPPDSGSPRALENVEELEINAIEEYQSEPEEFQDEPELPNESVVVNESTNEPTHSRDFDLTLPATHSYLGSNLEELRGRTLLDEGIYMDLPILINQSVVLFPGQTLPMTVFNANAIGMLQKCIKKNRTFGVVFRGNRKVENIGTTAEIYEFKPGSPREGFRIKAKGRQRFRIIQSIQKYGEIAANVEIVPEITLAPLFYEVRIVSLDHQRVKATNYTEVKKQEKIERLESTITTWPAWVYRQYDPQRLSLRIRHHLQYIETRGSCIPTDPTELSFWVAQNLTLDDDEKISLLKYNCAIPRLQMELKYIVKDRVLVCCHCGILIGKQSDVFPMSREGPQTTYCNPAGVIHDTVTLYHAEGIQLDDMPPTSEYTWFPGYAWTVANCEACGTHMGWLFTAAEDKSLRPATFWGLTRKNLRSKKVTS